MKHFFIYITLFILASCSSKEELNINVYEVRNIGQLSTTEYTIGKIIRLDDSSNEKEWYDPRKYGDRKILISCRAKVKAGIDLSTIQEDDIKIIGNTIEIILPPAEITSFSMDPSMINTEVESISGFRDSFTQSEKNDFLKQGEQSIRDGLQETGILDDAFDNAEAFLKDFYAQQGFEKIIVKQKTNE